MGKRPFSQNTVPDMPDTLQLLVDRGAQARFLGTRHGMHGWVTIFQGQEQYYYATPDGKGFLMGLLFDKDGTMATVGQVRELFNPKVMMRWIFWRLISQSRRVLKIRRLLLARDLIINLLPSACF